MKPQYIFIDESGVDTDSNIICMTLVATEDPNSIRKACVSLIEEIKYDPVMSTNIPSIRDTGIEHFHYTSDHGEVKTQFIKLLNGLNFDAYVVFARKEEIRGDFTKNTLLLKLFSSLLYSRIQEKNYEDIFVVYERFDEGSKKEEDNFKLEIEELRKKILDELCRFTEKIELSFENKSELCLGISDYVCAIVSNYIKTVILGGAVTDTLVEREYNRIEKKVRLIQDFTRKKFYSRQNPIDVESLRNQ